ncbi:MAG: hypothetical protein HZA11_03445 [Nitrospirae bacterium]|nr:hypothetical protein [Nitrospirota bacterium]
MEEKEVGVGCINMGYRDMGWHEKIENRGIHGNRFHKKYASKSKKGDDQVKYKSGHF